MLKRCFLLLFICGSLASVAGKVPEPARYESFEDGVPKTWHLEGKGILSTTPWHYKLGKKSLKWDFKAGDRIRINNTIGDTTWCGGRNNICRSGFGVWVYVPRALAGKNLRFAFRIGDKADAYFDFPLNFKGWQCAFPSYQQSSVFKNKQVSDKVDNILIEAPDDCDGTVLIDCVVYNGHIDSLYRHCLPRKTPWKAPGFDKMKYPEPKELTTADLAAIERVKKQILPQVVIGKKSSKRLEQVMDRIAHYQIVEDSHGIRGLPIPFLRQHSGGGNGNIVKAFFAGTGISEDQVEWFDKIAIGTTDKRYLNGIFNNTVIALSRGVTQSQYDRLCNEYVKLWKYILDQGFNCSHGNSYYYAGRVVLVSQAMYVVRGALFKSGLMERLFNYAQFARYVLFEVNNRPNMDYFDGLRSLYCLAFLYSNDPKQQIQVLRFLADKISGEITGDHGFYGFKVDGSGIHYGFKLEYMLGGVHGVGMIARAVANSSFALSDKAFDTLKKVVLNAYFYSNNLQVPLFLQGTEVFKNGVELYWLADSIKNLALAGRGGIDRELAQAYVNLKPSIKNLTYKTYSVYDDVFEKKYGIKPSALPTGNISMPYGHLMAQRRNDYLAIASGNYIDMRQRGNHYMYHGGNGALAILGKGGFYASGNAAAGWDWNRGCGTTVLYMPDLIDIKFLGSNVKVPEERKAALAQLAQWYGKYHDMSSNIRFKCAGGISWRGINGCFSDVFATDALNNVFRGIKTYFFINDRIYALGSDILSAKCKYHVQTNLYQKVLVKKDSPTFIDGKEIKTFPVSNEALDKEKNHYLLDPVGNGYYVPKGQRLFTARKLQKSRLMKYSKKTDSTGDFATAWIDHGITPESAGYEYVVLPYCGERAIAEFAEKASAGKAYKVLRKDDQAHIIHDLIDGFYAGIFFFGGKFDKLPQVLEVERACQIMYRQKGGSPEVAAGDINPHLKDTRVTEQQISMMKPLKITFEGKWKLQKPVEGVKLVKSSEKSTLISLDCIHGKSFNFTLQK